ncbi:MAG: GTP pyrophosphokinase [Anaerolineales bacterium]|nr:GTP pyrophosphokinase [Anaerolineales bacterium]
MIKAPPSEIERVVDKVISYAPDADMDLLWRAYDLVEHRHAGQMRATGEPYITHVVSVADILADLCMEPETIAAALLHDVVEDTDTSFEELGQQFGQEIASLVEGVTKLTKITRKGIKASHAENMRKLFLAMAENIRVVLIKLADRLHNMRTLWALPPEKQHRIATETLEIFTPLANRLGIWQIKWQLEDRALRALEPDIYEEISDQLTRRRREREAFVTNVIQTLRNRLEDEGIEVIDIKGRPKHIYSIYKKMRRKGVTFDEVYDVHAIRVLLRTMRDCYTALGIVHDLWNPIPGEFDDYVATPKENLYQSLHTAVRLPKVGSPLEVQIRTEEMHQVAEYGIAAHWRYKERRSRDETLEKKIAWLRQQLESHQEVDDAEEFLESVKEDVLPEQVYVFTPENDVIELPAGATPVDFGYRIHTEVGHRCRGAKVNGRMVALNTELNTTDRVEIVTAKEGGPSRDWLNPALGYVRTSRARSKVRQWFRRQERAENIAQGREVLDKELRRLGLNRESYDRVAALFGHGKVEDLLMAIGSGDINAQQITTRILEAEQDEEEKIEVPQAPPLTEPAGVTVMGVEDILTKVAKCCNPLPGDQVIGYITRGHGVTLHKDNCTNIRHLVAEDPERIIDVDWHEDSERVYAVMVRVLAYDRPGLVRDVSDVVLQQNVNMSAASAETSKKNNVAVVTATLEINSVRQLANILNKLSQLPNVFEVRREVA